MEGPLLLNVLMGGGKPMRFFLSNGFFYYLNNQMNFLVLEKVTPQPTPTRHTYLTPTAPAPLPTHTYTSVTFTSPLPTLAFRGPPAPPFLTTPHSRPS